MKFRVLAGALAIGMLLATTACSGNLANNAYRVNRAFDGNVRHTAQRDIGTRGTNRTANRATNRAYHGTTTGRAMNNSTANNRATARRLGNAAHNVGDTFNNVNNGTDGATRNVRTRTRHNVNNANNHYNTNRATRPNDTPDGRVDHSVDGVNTTNRNITERRTTAYRNPNNFTNTLYNEPYGGLIDGQNFVASNRADGINNNRLDARNNNAVANPNPTSNPGGRTMVNNNTARGTYRTNDNAVLDGNTANARDGRTATQNRTGRQNVTNTARRNASGNGFTTGRTTR
jgi:hypothetical protein